DRQRIGVLRAHVVEVDAEPLEGRAELRERVEPALALAPVVFLGPVCADVLHVREGRTLRPVVDALPLGPARAAQAPAPLVERAVARLDAEGLDSVAHGGLRG